MLSKRFVAIVLCILPALAAPSLLVPITKNANPVPGRYIVTLKDGVSLSLINSILDEISLLSKVTHKWNIVNAFAGSFTDVDLELLRAIPNIASIAQEGYFYTQATVTQ